MRAFLTRNLGQDLVDDELTLEAELDRIAGDVYLARVGEQSQMIDLHEVAEQVVSQIDVLT